MEKHYVTILYILCNCIVCIAFLNVSVGVCIRDCCNICKLARLENKINPVQRWCGTISNEALELRPTRYLWLPEIPEAIVRVIKGGNCLSKGVVVYHNVFVKLLRVEVVVSACKKQPIMYIVIVVLRSVVKYDIVWVSWKPEHKWGI